jgi:hypothetical protein
MKTQNTITDIWKKGKGAIENQPVPDINRVRQLSRKHVNMNRLVMLTYLIVYMLMLAASVVIQIINIGGYAGNSLMLLIHGIVLIVSAAFLVYGAVLLSKVIQMTRPDLDLTTTIRSQIRFYKRDYEIWLWLVAFSVLLLTFAVNTMVDNDNGIYRINNPLTYAGLQIGIFFFMYLILKAAHYPLLKELRAHLSDLENQTTEATARFETQKRKWRWWMVAGMLAIAALLAYAAIKGIVVYR